MNTLATWAQVVSAVGAAVAAIAAWRSASAALRTAGRADETSRRAVEALGRATKPVLAVVLDDSTGTSHREDQQGGRSRGGDPVPMRLFVDNSSANRGMLTAARLHRTDGFAATATGAAADGDRYNSSQVRDRSPGGRPARPDAPAVGAGGLTDRSRASGFAPVQHQAVLVMSQSKIL